MYKAIVDRLETSGINASFQRVKILEYLMKQKAHPTAEEVHQALHQEVPTLSKATVYNTLNLLSEKGLVKTLMSLNTTTRYDAILDQHGHFVCIQCGIIYDFSFAHCGRNLNLEGFQIQSEELLLKGVCKHCSQKNSTR